jgi:cytoskeletal protein RodZ
MKSIFSVTLAAALLITGVAFAQTATPPSDDSMSQSQSSNSDISQNNAPANHTPSKATDASQGDAAPQSVSQACDKQASDKNLSGDAKTTWLKKCKMGKTTRSGN